jgi:hypothetical protein
MKKNKRLEERRKKIPKIIDKLVKNKFDEIDKNINKRPVFILEDYTQQFLNTEHLNMNKKNSFLWSMGLNPDYTITGIEFKGTLSELLSEYDNSNTTKLKTVNDGWNDINVTDCCEIGPIIDENYCPNCGKRIIKT